MKPGIIAFYLPQYHPFPENDEWWGRGFTEWTNVGKAKPLFKGHNQPRVPTELGYYDLRLPVVREQQAQLAREAGVTAFCYWHYWFGNGKRLIADVFDEVLSTGKPDFPFCLGWANHSWYAKNWNSDGTTKQKLLIEQTYPGINDEKEHFAFLLKAFQDKRYVKVERKPLLYIFDPINIPRSYVSNLKQWTKDYGFNDLYLVANISNLNVDRAELYAKGFDAVSYQRLGTPKPTWLQLQGEWGQHIYAAYKRMIGFIRHRPPLMYDYKDIYHNLVQPCDADIRVIPTLLPQWDHTPRSGWNGHLLVNATPEMFKRHAREVLNIVKNKPNNYQLVFLKSWNEWGEGNMMEPDITFGRGFVDALREVLKEFS